LLACLGLIVVASLFAPHVLQLYQDDISLYPLHNLNILNTLNVVELQAGTMRRPHFLREWVDNGIDTQRKIALSDPSAKGNVELYREMSSSYVQVPISVIIRCGAVSGAFFLIVIIGLSLIFARFPRLIPAMTAVLFVFAIGAASGLALGLYQSSVIIAYDIADDFRKSLWSYPGLIIAVTVWTTLVFGVLGYGLANTLPNRPQRSIERAY
jgi:hypothetical protein